MNANDETTPRRSEDPNGGSAHQPPPGGRFTNLARGVLLGLMVVVALVSIGSYAMSRRAAPVAKQAAGKTLYHCPMHPSYTSDKPGDCPICGMSLVPVEKPEAPAAGPRKILFYRNPMNPEVHSPVPMKDEMGMDYVPVYADEQQAGGEGGSDVPGLVDVNISPERVQLIGVRTAVVRASHAAGQLDLVGFVTPEESRLRRVQIRVSGWVRDLYVNETGVRVKAGQRLLSLYSPELFQSEQEYLINRGARDSAAGPEAVGPRAAAERLRLLGVPEEEIQRLDREGRAATELVLHSPVSGTVLERGVVEGQYVRPDTPLLTVADLSSVWVMADLYEMDMTRVHVGDEARFTTDALPGRTFAGRVDFVYPTVSNVTRTLKARFAIPNDAGALRPGMYGRARVSARGARSLSVPAEAVINTGESQYVFLARAGGRFEPRLVVTGLPEGNRIQILRGVAAGDTVVASASFLIDSESRLQAAIAGMGAKPGEPGMTGKDHGEGGAK